MVRSADVVIDNYRLGRARAAGHQLRHAEGDQSGIISCSINAYGDTDRGGAAGFLPLMQAEGGMMAAQGGDGDPVLTPSPSMTSPPPPWSSAALNARNGPGRGRKSSPACWPRAFSTSSARWWITPGGRRHLDLGGRDCVGLTALYRFYPCADGWLAVILAPRGAGRREALGLDRRADRPSPGMATWPGGSRAARPAGRGTRRSMPCWRRVAAACGASIGGAGGRLARTGHMDRRLPCSAPGERARARASHFTRHLASCARRRSWRGTPARCWATMVPEARIADLLATGAPFETP